jgi:hypothetical protein
VVVFMSTWVKILEGDGGCAPHFWDIHNIINPYWVIPAEKIHAPMEKISIAQRGRREKCISGKCIKTSKGGRGLSIQFPLLGELWMFLVNSG